MNIQRITWLYKLAESTIGINKTGLVEEIQIFQIDLKNKIIPTGVLKIIDKVIPYPILHILKYGDEFMYCISLKMAGKPDNYYQSEWNEKIEFDFSGIDLEKVYQKIIKNFIRNVRTEEEAFSDILDRDEKISLLKVEISRIEKKIKSEKQFNKKVELNQNFINKKNDLKALMAEG